MRNFKLLLVWLMLGGTLLQCGLPSKPNFTTSQTIEAPLLKNKTFQFLGGGEGNPEALLDTTKGDFDSLFTVTPDGENAGLISINTEEEFEFGDLNDAIPEISADPTDFSSQVGEIELGSFSSGNGNLGTASFESITGLNPAVVPQGTPLPAGETLSPININVGENTDFFVSATIKSGALEITVNNSLGFNIKEVVLDLKSGAVVVGSTTFTDLDHGSSQSQQITFSDGDVLSSLNVDINVEWEAQNTQAEPGNLIVESISGVDLIASSVEAAVTEQDFSSSSSATFDNAEFQFTSTSHYVELESGTILIDPIVNELDLTVESLLISFPNIRKGPNFTEADSLVIAYTGDEKILRSDVSVAQEIDLSGYRIFALNNEITYNIQAITENTQEASPGDQTRVISESNKISSRVEINNLKIARAVGEINPQTVVLGDDDPFNGSEVIDIYNESEVSLTTIEGLEDLSSEIDGIEFSGASLSFNYTTNIGVSTTIYAAILGINGDGEEVYLKGKPGSDKEVTESAPIYGIKANGDSISVENMIKFSIQPSPDGSQITGIVTFDEDNSTVNDFLNNLPSEIRFVGKAVINQEGGEATIANPLEFDTQLMVDLPIYFSANGASYSTKVGGDNLEDLPTEEDDSQISSGEVFITYENGLPFGFDLEFVFLDEFGSEITRIPLDGDDPIILSAATVDPTSRFVSSPINSELVIGLNKDQFARLGETDSISVSATLNTFENEEVKVRDTDSITLSISSRFTLETKVEDN